MTHYSALHSSQADVASHRLCTDFRKTRSLKALASLTSVAMDKGKSTWTLGAGPRAAFSPALSWVERVGWGKKDEEKEERENTGLALPWMGL